MVKIILTIVFRIFRIFKRRPCILFESIPDYSDNTMSVFEEMVRRGFDKKYDLVWLRSRDGTIPAGMERYPSVNFTQKVGWYLFRFYRVYATCIICCNHYISSCNPHISQNKKNCLVFYLGHGTPFKSLAGRYEAPGFIDYFLVPSECTIPIFSREFDVDAAKIFALGYPRNDDLLKDRINLNSIFETDATKFVVWYPTFRQQIGCAKKTHGSSLPLIHDPEIAVELNEFARQRKIFLILKPHFAQDISYITRLKLSNICFIDDEFFPQHQISSYRFVGSCDALITDYSSVMFDFLLLNRPIALIWEDIEEYRKYPGIALETERHLDFASKIYTLSDLKEFLHDLCIGEDKFGAQRNAANKFFNYSSDTCNSSRVVDFIVEKAKL